MNYQFVRLNSGVIPIETELLEVSSSNAKNAHVLKHYFEKFEKYTYEQLRKAKLIKKIKGHHRYKLHEFRIEFPQTTGRIIFIIAEEEAQFLYFFIKKSDDLKQKHIEISENRADSLKK